MTQSINIVLWPTTEIHLQDIVDNVFFMLKIQNFKDITVNSAFDLKKTNIVIGSVAYSRYPMHIPDGSIIVNMEQLYDESNWNTPWYRSLLTNPKMKIVDYNKHNQNWLKTKLNIDVPIITFGWYPKDQEIYSQGKPIDVLFFGGVNERRMKFINKIQQLGINFSVRNNNLFREERGKIIRQSKIVINCHFHDIGLLEWPRVQYLINNQCFVISEDSINKDEYDDCCKIVYSKFDDADDMVEKIKYYLTNYDERERMANYAHIALKNTKSCFPM